MAEILSAETIHWESSENRFFLNPKFSPKQTRELLAMTSVVDSQGVAPLTSHIFLLSSGTTASSNADSIQGLKWIALSKAAFLESARAVNHHVQSHSADVWLHPLPDFHVGGLGIRARAYVSGASVVKLEEWDAQAFVDLISSRRVTLTAIVPAQVFDLVREARKCPPSLRAVFVGAGALSPVLYQSALRLGWPLLPTYGMTEVCSQAATAPLQSVLKIDDDSLDMPPLEILSHLEAKVSTKGCLCFKGSSLLTGFIYQAQGRAVFEDPKQGGWFQSQDRGAVDGPHLKILGRTGDFVKIGGESVELQRLRELLDEVRTEMELSADVALLAVPDERLGHVICLVAGVTLSLDQESHLTRSYNSLVLGFEKIRKCCRLEKIPRTPLGKLIPAECLRAISAAVGSAP